MIDGGYHVTTVTDITESTRRETKLAKREALVSSVLNTTDQGIIIADNDERGTVERYNTAYAELFDCADRPVDGSKTFLDLFHDAWKAGAFDDEEVNNFNDDEFVSRAMEIVEKSTREPLTIKLKNDRFVRFTSHMSDVNHRLFTFTDITQNKVREIEYDKARKHAENMLADFNTVVNNMDVGLLLVDKNLDVLIINEAFKKIWKMESADFKPGDNIRDLMEYNRHREIYDVDDARWGEYIDARLAEISAGEIEPREILRADGRTLVFSCAKLTGGNRLLRYQDVTDFKHRETELEKAQLRAESADRSKSEFLANMSHEIRTPMNGVMGMAELLSKTELTDKQKMFTDVILNSSTALLTIINDILDFSKIEAGKLELDTVPFCLSEAIQDVVTLVSTNVNEKELELIVRVQPGLPDHVLGDVGRFRQVLTNLVGNAVKFTEKGHILIDVSGEVNDGIVEMRCAVEDTGIGIPADQIDTIFEKFSQVDGSSTRKHEGTGLGLAISSKLAELMGGEIGCRSIVGEGSTFWFTATMPVHKEAKKKIAASINIEGANLLAIDDHAVNRSILLEQFEAWKLNGVAGATGLEGLALLRQSHRVGKPIDAVVLDYHMPDMNGIDVTRVIRSDEKLKHTPIIMLTSVDNVSETAEFRALDIDDHLTKPARASQLLEAIIGVLQNSKMATENGNDDKSATSDSDQHRPHGDTGVAGKGVREQIKLAEQRLAEMTGDGEREELCILVAEDNDVNQMVFTQILEYQEFNFKIVENGLLAVEEVMASRPKIVLMDISMPVMNGLDATREIRKRFDGADGYRPVIIGVTAHALKDDREKCLEVGMDDYMSKPISPDMLIDKIRHWMPDIDSVTEVQNAG